MAEPHRINGLAVNQAGSGALWEALTRVHAPLFDSPLGPAERREFAQGLVDAFERQLLRLYSDDVLAAQLAALPLPFDFSVAMLDDPEDGTPQVERGMAFGVALVWSLRSYREDLGIG